MRSRCVTSALMFMFSCADALKLSWQAVECVSGAGRPPEQTTTGLNGSVGGGSVVH